MTDKSSPSVERRAYATNEFAAAFGMSRARVYELMANGELEYKQFGTRRLIPVEAAEAWFASLPDNRSAAA
jgi:excisionase family DNA binding protein